MQEIGAIRQEAVSISSYGRVCTERIKPDLEQFFDDTVEMATQFESVYEDSFLLNRLLYMVSFAADIFADEDMSDEDYELFKGYLNDLDTLRKEVIGAYEVGENSDRIIGSKPYVLKKVTSLWSFVRSAGKWNFAPNDSMFRTKECMCPALHRMLTVWDKNFAVGKMLEKMIEKYGLYMRDHINDYSEEEFLELFNDLLDGKKNFTDPIPVYVRSGSTVGIVDAGTKVNVDFCFIRSSDGGNHSVRIYGYDAI